jgi:hypothetical protein
MGLLSLLIDVGTEIVQNVKEKKTEKREMEAQKATAKAQANTVNSTPQAPNFTIPVQTQNKFARAVANRNAGTTPQPKKNNMFLYAGGAIVAVLLMVFLIFKKK